MRENESKISKTKIFYSPKYINTGEFTSYSIVKNQQVSLPPSYDWEDVNVPSDGLGTTTYTNTLEITSSMSLTLVMTQITSSAFSVLYVAPYKNGAPAVGSQFLTGSSTFSINSYNSGDTLQFTFSADTADAETWTAEVKNGLETLDTFTVNIIAPP